MLGDFVVETLDAGFSGTGTYNLGGAYGAYKRWRDKFTTGKRALYVVKTTAASPNGAKFEQGLGTFTEGAPDTISRTTIIASSNAGSAVEWQASDICLVYSAPSCDVLAGLVPDWVDKGAANYTAVAGDIGSIFEFNVGGANRTLNLPAGSAVSRFFRLGVYGYGSTSNNVAVTPGSGSDSINEGGAGAALNVLGGVLTFLHWDPTKSAWRTAGS